MELGVDRGKGDWIVYRVAQSRKDAFQLREFGGSSPLRSECRALNFNTFADLEQFHCGGVTIPKSPLKEVPQRLTGHRPHDGAFTVRDRDDVFGCQYLQSFAHDRAADPEFLGKAGLRRQKCPRSEGVTFDQREEAICYLF